MPSPASVAGAGFTFGVPSPAVADSEAADAVAGAGFTFGGPSPAVADSQAEAVAAGFTFGVTAADPSMENSSAAVPRKPVRKAHRSSCSSSPPFPIAPPDTKALQGDGGLGTGYQSTLFGIQVRGAGNPAVNGTYKPDGLVDDVQSFLNGEMVIVRHKMRSGNR